jgi:hypothetical protein
LPKIAQSVGPVWYAVRRKRYKGSHNRSLKVFGLTLDKASAKRRFGDGYFRELWKEFLVFRALGGLRDDGDQYELTRRGRYFWVMMMREFFTGVNNFRDEMRAYIKEEYEASYGSQPVRILERSGIQ